MGNLIGRDVDLILKRLEIQSEDKATVLSFTRNTKTKEVEIRIRNIDDSPYDSDWRTPSFVFSDEDARTLRYLLSGENAFYNVDTINRIKSDRPYNPPPTPEKEDCSPIAIADAQAAAALTASEARIAAAKFEMRLDHSRGLHTLADVEGCEDCENKQQYVTSSIDDLQFSPPLNDEEAEEFLRAVDAIKDEEA